MLNMNKIKLPTFDKEFFRTEVKQRISRLSEEERNQFSEEISNTLLNLPRISETDTVIIYQ